MKLCCTIDTVYMEFEFVFAFGLWPDVTGC